MISRLNGIFVVSISFLFYLFQFPFYFHYIIFRFNDIIFRLNDIIVVLISFPFSFYKYWKRKVPLKVRVH